MFVVIDKTTLSAIALSLELPPADTYGNAWIVPVPDGYTVTLPSWTSDGEYTLGTTWTLDQILAYVEKYETLIAKQEEAIANAIATVNGTLIGDLTSTQLKTLLLILIADRGWITADNRIAVS